MKETWQGYIKSGKGEGVGESDKKLDTQNTQKTIEAQQQ